jgi:hypothetical protein
VAGQCRKTKLGLTCAIDAAAFAAFGLLAMTPSSLPARPNGRRARLDLLFAAHSGRHSTTQPLPDTMMLAIFGVNDQSR